ncbi:hypothetical protein AB0D10_19925 [Kitasatospora sp. NPDC048545]|uniref:hypothetical protein n=1 Tax=Kitasatospora sp. NPDC048545 TaxID=3157208 RepID=UPI0033C92F5B
MSNESSTGGPADAAGDGAAVAARALGDLAGSVETGAVPYDRLVAGGRRRLRRRRLLTAAAAAVLVTAVVGGGAVLGERGRQTVSTVAAASASVSASGSAPSSAAATPTAPARDPFTPVRVRVGEGTVDGRSWQAWAALWPAAPTREDAHRQEELLWEDRHAAIPQLPRTTDAEVDRAWRADLDAVNLYLTLDGTRQVDDSVHRTVVPGGPTAVSLPPSPFSGGGTVLGLKGAELGDSPVLICGVAPQVAKVVVTWVTGGSTEAVPVAVGDSPTHWFALAKKPGSDARTFTLYAADGSVLGADTTWFRSS